MLKRTLSFGAVVVVGLMSVPFAGGTAAFAAGAHFRKSHGEPLNDPHVTPGATFNVSAATVCRSGYATRVRNVPESEKIRAYAEYGVVHHTANQFEVDHLIPLELGGSNVIANLWPELNDHPPGYLNSKDILENRLHSLVCSRVLSLHSAQTQISTDWVSTYYKYLGTWPSGRTSTALPTTTSGTGETAPPGSSRVRITSVVGSVAPGGTVTLHAHSRRPNDSCNLVVILPSGRRSTARGLGTTSADARGDATWTWQIGSRTRPGTAAVTVTCRAGDARGTLVIA